MGLAWAGSSLSIAPVLAQSIADAASSPQNSTSVREIVNQAQYSFTDPQSGETVKGTTNSILFTSDTSALTDPRGQILGCGGKPLDNYEGFTVALYEPSPASSLSLGQRLSLTRTELPDIPGNSIPKGIAPNSTNQNPFALSNADEGRYSFLLDRTRGQLAVGKVYILVVAPPSNSSLYEERQIKLEIIDIRPDAGRDVVAYRATSMDGLPIGVEGEMTIEQTVVLISDADAIGLQLLAFQLRNGLCQQNQIQIAKSGDRSAAQPGDTVIYRLSVKNASDGDLDEIAITDVLPAGFRSLKDSVRAEFKGAPVPIALEQQGQTLRFRLGNLALPKGESITIAYATQLTPDALRGNGKNTANVRGQRTDNDVEVRDGPAIHTVRISAGLVSNCGIILGRVFEDRNFDGEQQDGEPGIPNAVVFLEDGNRITTDKNGLFSVKCALPGSHTGVLDPLSIPDYRLAPNRHFIERNSASRLVRLAPGGMVRMNFGVMPAAGDKP
ncbi:hypothetical protein [Altericista sp. CCNU0014]|uniref:hypothetical protein n=1 Tax=Altericista sp. CCNU0014 TaxID=3082949 RepID=UPI00384EFC02